jgi:hypothetical protein
MLSVASVWACGNVHSSDEPTAAPAPKIGDALPMCFVRPAVAPVHVIPTGSDRQATERTELRGGFCGFYWRVLAGAASFFGCEKVWPSVRGFIRCAVEVFNLGSQLPVRFWVVACEAAQGNTELALLVFGTARHRVQKIGDGLQRETLPSSGLAFGATNST